jgi:hypothetical protein
MSTTCPFIRPGAARRPIPGLKFAGLVFAGLLIVGVAAAAPAADAIAPTPATAPAAAPATATATAAAPADLGQALRAVVDEARGRLRELHAAMKAAPDPQQAAALRAETESIQRDLRRRLLEVQLEFAQKNGDAALVDELTGILQRLDQPAVGVPQNRPAPAQTPQPAPAAR